MEGAGRMTGFREMNVHTSTCLIIKNTAKKPITPGRTILH
jgi:hypothetical protein